ncbi:hypothetical protein OHA25_34945 [Nonomuraea sp. NBC_00507]|uniref:hypothetical protein n=1 Tax=Nonomuraea sp. NBC_00507 TaxID=2976002 RepID=UPI002E194246
MKTEQIACPDNDSFRCPLARSPDRLSARWLPALAAQLVRDVGALITRAAPGHQRVATFAIDGEVRFASAADRAAFAEEPAS